MVSQRSTRLILAWKLIRLPIAATKGSNDESTPSQVSWYSIFWALFALAVNSMSQPSILDNYIPASNLLFPAHSSPIACVADAGDALLDLFIQLIFGEKIRKAAANILWRRARDRIGSTIEVVEETTPEKFTVATAIIFIGPLSQAIKLYGCEGILWAKVIATMYLSSYLVLTLLTFLASPNWRSSPPILTPLKSSTSQRLVVYKQLSVQIGITFLVIQPLLYFWFIDGIIQRSASASGEPTSPRTTIESYYSTSMSIPGSFLWTFGLFLAFMVPFNTLLIGGSVIVRGILAPDTETRLCYFGAFITVVPALVTFCYTTYPSVAQFANLIYIPHTGRNHLGLFAVGLLAILVVVLVVIDQRIWIKRRVPFLQQWFVKDSTVWLVAFAVFNVSFLLFYLVKGYDSTGTVKPAWTDRLG